MNTDLDKANGYLAEMSGGLVVGIGVGLATDITVHVSEADEFYISAADITVESMSGSFEVETQVDPSSAAPLLALVMRARISSASVSSAGELTVELDTGHTLEVAVNPMYEAWQVNGPRRGNDQLLIVGSPGGGFVLVEPRNAQQ